MTKDDVEKAEVFVGDVTSPLDLVVMAAWPIVGAVRAHADVKGGSTRIDASRRYAALLTIWLVGAGLSIASALAVVA